MAGFRQQTHLTIIQLMLLLLSLLLVSGGAATAQFSSLAAAQPRSFYVDMGNPDSEAAYNLENWADAEIWNPVPAPSGDKTKRFLKLRQDGDAHITFAPLITNSSHRLSTEVEDGECTDNFQIFANGTMVYDYIGKHTGTRLHIINIPGHLVRSDSLRLTFRNTGTDKCGHVGVWNIRLEPQPTPDFSRPTEAGGSASPRPSLPDDERDDRELSTGETVSGNINPADDVDSFVFYANPGQFVSLRMNATAGSRLDSFLSLYDADGTTLLTQADNDEGGPGFNALIDRYQLPQTGLRRRFRVRASSYLSASTGSYAITMTLEDWRPPMRGNWEIYGYAPGEEDHKNRDYWAVDFRSDDKAVYSVLPGHVAASGWNCGRSAGQQTCYGFYVVMDHGDGLYTIYTHLKSDSWLAVPNRQYVDTNYRIGTMAESGCSGCGEHLHFVARRGPKSGLGESVLFQDANEPVKTPWNKTPVAPL